MSRRKKGKTVDIKVKVKQKKKKSSKRIRKINVPMAIATKIPPPRFRRVKSKENEQEIVVSGEDLIIPVPNTQEDFDSSNSVFINFPANPLYWSGTRLAGLARVYQQYRPLKLTIDYIPQVPVTTAGQVIMGTLWNIESKASSLQQNLMTSDGAQMIQCYQKAVSRVNLRSSKLPQRYFNVFGDMSSQNTNPFMWMALYTGTSASGVKQPGYIYVHWTYKFSVALGDRDIPVESISQTDDELIRTRFKSPPNSSIGWGIALSALRGLKNILRNTAVFFLRSVAVSILENINHTSNDIPESTIIGVGRCYNLDVASIKEEHMSITDDTGNHYMINDESVRVCVYSHGESVSLEPEEYINVSGTIPEYWRGFTKVSEDELNKVYTTMLQLSNVTNPVINQGLVIIYTSLADDHLLHRIETSTDSGTTTYCDVDFIISAVTEHTSNDIRVSMNTQTVNYMVFSEMSTFPTYFALDEWLAKFPIA